MKLRIKLASGLAVLSLGLVPAAGLANGVNYAPEHPTHPTTPKGKAYGFFCKGQSREHLKGEQGTAFSRCVKGGNEMRRGEREKEAATSA